MIGVPLALILGSVAVMCMVLGAIFRVLLKIIGATVGGKSGRPPVEAMLIRMGHGVSILAVTGYLVFFAFGWDYTIRTFQFAYYVLSPGSQIVSHREILAVPIAIIVAVVFAGYEISSGQYFTKGAFDGELIHHLMYTTPIAVLTGILLLYVGLHDLNFWSGLADEWDLDREADFDGHGDMGAVRSRRSGLRRWHAVSRIAGGGT